MIATSRFLAALVCTKIRFWPGLRPGHRWGRGSLGYNAPPDYLAGFSVLECIKFDFGRVSVPDPTRRAYNAPPDPLAGLRGPTSN